ncbi:oxidoreductase, short chain dehydrogenase/reductase family-like protein [Alcanivorax hongdengensis A-11-3]|uniref:Oxidoreductase, short chain dehydrogenase/reductase family-like protein n=1 Tax=Alcanivorax hongdengensis A-11-3 TaxID=1177179 RepID=L0WE93_9GAMM|nr:SDR family oxidoreductase [Alcanivorax hongdengensis]EKF75044.1 oxidoreductase, short chain dehydrogenase/reductase family-like protein [Alcanivorax hongdengensis A-11-3]
MQAVMVTGASAGIGEEFARQLAAEGHNLVLVARRLEKMQALAATLSQTHGVQVHCLEADLADSGSAAQLVERVQSAGIRISGLVNNAGFGDRGHVGALSLERQLNMVQLNVTTLMELTWRLLPQLREASEAFIINVASTAAFQAGPNMAVYYASKAFVLSFSEALHEEEKGNGVAVSALCPGATASEFASEANMTHTLLFKAGTMTPQAVVRKALASRKRAIVIPGLKNRILVWLGKISPRIITRRLAGLLQA